MYYKSVSAIAGGGKTAVLLNTFSKGLARCSGSNWVFFPDPNWLCAPGANNSFDVNIIVGLARADFSGKDIDMFMFAMQLYQIEMYTVEKLQNMK